MDRLQQSIPYDQTLQQIMHYLDIGRTEQALDKLHHLLSDHPRDSYLFFLSARCHYLLDQYDQAIRFCREALELHYFHEECYFLMGIALMENEQLVEAEEALLQTLSLQPEHAEALAAYGYLMLKTGHEEKACRLLQEALRLEPENSVVLHYQFLFFTAKNQESEQAHYLEQFIHSSDSEVEKLLHLGMMELSRENYKEARELYRQAFLLDPTNKQILEILQELDQATHVLYFPQRVIAKLGGPIPVWIGFLVLLFALRSADLESVAGIVSILYFILVIASWTTPFLYKAWLKWRK